MLFGNRNLILVKMAEGLMYTTNVRHKVINNQVIP